jgi:hypothetical protein
MTRGPLRPIQLIHLRLAKGLWSCRHRNSQRHQRRLVQEAFLPYQKTVNAMSPPNHQLKIRSLFASGHRFHKGSRQQRGKSRRFALIASANPTISLSKGARARSSARRNRATIRSMVWITRKDVACDNSPAADAAGQRQGTPRNRGWKAARMLAPAYRDTALRADITRLEALMP